MLVNIITNATKAQYKHLGDGTWLIQRIPITVDDTVMNGVFYSKEDNEKGLATYREKPLCLSHPVDENGDGISAFSGVGLLNHFAGVITNVYNIDGVNYCDATIKEKMMLGQSGGEYFVHRLRDGLPIGVSTGLFFDDNNNSGKADNGDAYYAVAKNQKGDHVAMLPGDESPAGGAGTTIQFNGEKDVQKLLVNIDKVMGVATNSGEPKKEAEKDKGKLLNSLVDSLKQMFAKATDGCDNGREQSNEIQTNEEEDRSMRKLLENALKKKGVKFNSEDSDQALIDLLATNAKDKDKDDDDDDDDDKMKGKKKPMPESNSANDAILAAVNSLSEKVSGLESKLSKNEDAELSKVAKQVSDMIGVDVDSAKAMGLNSLYKVIAKNGDATFTPDAVNHQSPQANIGSSISSSPWLEK